AKGGTVGMLFAVGLVIVLYACFTFSYAELSSAIPKAGGVFDYAARAFNIDVGFIAGIAQWIEFVFAPPAIAIAIGTYLHLSFPGISIQTAAISVYVIFTALNIYGIRAAARFELFITLLAVIELLLFVSLTLPEFSVAAFTLQPLINGWSGIFAALPFAIWFFLGIEGLANVAEECIKPQRDIVYGFGSALVTLVILCVLVFFSAVGIQGWEAIVFLPDGTSSDSPLPLALGKLFSQSHIFYQLLVGIGLFGLVASFHGLLLSGGRATYEMGRAKQLPAWLGKVHPSFQTPANALIINSILGIIIVVTGATAEIITLSVFGAITLYILAMLSVIRLRNCEPNLNRPFRVPGYPFTPYIALILSLLALVSLIWYNWQLALGFFCMLGISFFIFKWKR
ncbi:MAG: amino acid permease, partial [Sediminibacterium sp.]|nr:amino acid permease [Sediminibacterium sp.]